MLNMTKRITIGKIIASVIALIIGGFFWNIFFPPGGSGANILLGLFVAYFFVYYVANYVGGFLDQEFFYGASKERAKLYRSLERFLKESHEHLKAIKKSRRKQQKLSQQVLLTFTQVLQKSSDTLNEVKLNWVNGSANAHIASLKAAYLDLERAGNQIFNLDRNWRFLYGMPSLIIALLCALLLREFIIEPYQIPSGSMIPSLLVGDHLFVAKYYYGLSKPFSNDPDFIARWRDPKPGDVVVFKAPDYVGRHAGQAWIKRLIATEGQTVKIERNIVYIDGKPLPHIEPDNMVTYMDFIGFGGPDGGRWEEQIAKKTIEEINGVKHPIHMSIYPPSLKLGPNWPLPLTVDMPGLTCNSDGCKVKNGYVFVMGDNRGNSADSRVWGALPVSRIKGKALFIWMSVDGSKQSLKLGPFTLPNFRFERWFTSII